MSFQRRFRENRKAAVTGAAAAALLGGIFLIFPLGAGLAHLSYDLALTVRPAVPVDEVILVPLDEVSHEKLRQPDQQAWDRALYARVITNLTRWNVRAIALDIEFEENLTNTVADRALAEALRFNNGRAVLGAGWGRRHYFREANENKLRLPDEQFLLGDTNWGVVDLSQDSDGTVREHRHGDDVIPSLSWRLATLVGAPAGRAPNAQGRVRWLNYYGRAGSLPQKVFHAVWEGTEPGLSNLFAGKVVFVGAGVRTGYTGAQKEGFRNPQSWLGGGYSPGMEVHATMFLNLLRGDWLERPAPLLEVGIILLAGVVLGFWLATARPLAALGWAAGAMLFVVALGCGLAWMHVWFAWAVITLVQIPVGLVCAVAFRAHVAEEAQRRDATTEHPRVTQPAAAGAPHIPDYEMLRCVGSGSYGEVWLARSATGQFRAVKLVHRRGLGTDKQFEREFEGLVRFEPISRKHEGLVDILHVGRNEAEGYFYYIMELADAAKPQRVESGSVLRVESHRPTANPSQLSTQISLNSYAPHTLRRDTRPAARLPLDECLRVGLALTAALEFLHEQGLLHRDIKPSNIIYVDGSPKLADIGLVTRMDEARSFVGTEGFIPPEGPGTVQTDIFSLGKVLFEVRTGRDARQFPDFGTPAEAPSDTMTEFHRIVRKACESDLRERYATARAMHDELQRLQKSMASGQPRV